MSCPVMLKRFLYIHQLAKSTISISPISPISPSSIQINDRTGQPWPWGKQSRSLFILARLAFHSQPSQGMGIREHHRPSLAEWTLGCRGQREPPGHEPQGNTLVPVAQHRHHLARRLACNMLEGDHTEWTRLSYLTQPLKHGSRPTKHVILTFR